MRVSARYTLGITKREKRKVARKEANTENDDKRELEEVGREWGEKHQTKTTGGT